MSYSYNHAWVDRLVSARLGLDHYLAQFSDWLLAEGEAGHKETARAAADKVAEKLESAIDAIREAIT